MRSKQTNLYIPDTTNKTVSLILSLFETSQKENIYTCIIYR